MRPPSRKLMYTDFVIQMLMLVPFVFSSLAILGNEESILLAGLLMFFLGIWQSLSSLYTNLYLRLKSRRIHVVLVILYFAFLYLILRFYNYQNRQSEIYFAYMIIAGNLIAIYYAWVTYTDYRKLEVVEKENLIAIDLDGDILDAGMVGEE